MLKDRVRCVVQGREARPLTSAGLPGVWRGGGCSWGAGAFYAGVAVFSAGGSQHINPTLVCPTQVSRQRR